MPLHGELAEEKTPWVAEQLAAIDAAGTTEVADVQGMSVAVFTIRGRKSGKLRRVPLMRVEHDGAYALVASKGGAPEHPTWYLNVTAHPEVEVQDGTQRFDGVVRELSGDEREQWWERAVAAYPPYAEYQTKTDRQIPVLVVERTA
ncbi:deazaflavin-dependent oxidoreductase (nitroreductase family) [Barrientosiimonas humi]|uniref:Deazaflavin-dependent oxidoreductase (Nitroreductase family) n=2 Tax=Barrientosiimonas TaxID=1535207 RepID=A0A542XBI6_9MICO|nr:MULTISPECIES: nitroreductase family deazaflavin-dependent oxidoreductase [Barrientosiimonas]TQL33202.1 deazaflavin-dependent oxidoreductase (nitroreductase family) [Barrientosiimonas humi]BDZ58093.1 nitroreductase [Barrientosiimonas endolithica]CAG7573191.1 F420H(2)-dependent quinone reductase [Barrientosiimonas humi]